MAALNDAERKRARAGWHASAADFLWGAYPSVPQGVRQYSATGCFHWRVRLEWLQLLPNAPPLWELASLALRDSFYSRDEAGRHKLSWRLP